MNNILGLFNRDPFSLFLKEKKIVQCCSSPKSSAEMKKYKLEQAVIKLHCLIIFSLLNKANMPITDDKPGNPSTD